MITSNSLKSKTDWRPWVLKPIAVDEETEQKLLEKIRAWRDKSDFENWSINNLSSDIEEYRMNFELIYQRTDVINYYIDLESYEIILE